MSSTAPEVKTEARQWPYVSFRGLLNFFERLEQAKAVPPQIDRGVVGGTENQKNQLMAALRFLGLVGESGAATDGLRRIVEEPKTRPQQIRALWEAKYPAATELARVNGTTSQLADTFVGMSGDTLRKAMTFYMHGAKYAQLPTSKFFKIPSGFSTSRKRSRNAGGAAPADPTSSVTQAVAADAKTAYLAMLMERAKTSEKLDTGLLDRIERLLGYQQGDGQDPGNQ